MMGKAEKKDEVLAIRCSDELTRRFKVFAASRGMTHAEALDYLLRKMGFQEKEIIVKIATESGIDRMKRKYKWEEAKEKIRYAPRE